ncbi:MAG TPA: glycerophosphodiester phosphodiesterase [Acidimicrobiia bacterium]|nr:glycerophosphodiester phosphodiesterase [Acidimicrobiia bacterium]
MSLDRWTPPVAIAHRGSRLLWPENTMVAFSGAVSLGFRHLETDLHLTSDGVLVCHHDPTVARTTDGSGRVSDLTFAQLSALDAGYRHVGPDGHTFRGMGVRVPALEEAVLAFPEVSFVVDLKTDGLIEPLHRLIESVGLHDRLIVGSFSDRRLGEFRALSRGRVATSTGATSSRSWLFASRIGRGVRGEARALQLPARSRGVRVVDRRLVRAAHARGLQVHVWTVNATSEMIELLDLGVDGIITDRPDLLKQVLLERGVWE